MGFALCNGTIRQTVVERLPELCPASQINFLSPSCTVWMYICGLYQGQGTLGLLLFTDRKIINRGTQAALTYIMVTAFYIEMTEVKNDNWGGHSTVAVNSLHFFHLGNALSAKGRTLLSKMIHGGRGRLDDGTLVALGLSRASPSEMSALFVFNWRISRISNGLDFRSSQQNSLFKASTLLVLCQLQTLTLSSPRG